MRHALSDADIFAHNPELKEPLLSQKQNVKQTHKLTNSQTDKLIH
jgi:hypothetical protein